MKRMFVLLFLAACTGETYTAPPLPADPLAKIAYCDSCSVNFLKDPTCLHGGDGLVTDCPMPDGTWWQEKLYADGGTPTYRRFRVDANGATDLCICDKDFCGATF